MKTTVTRRGIIRFASFMAAIIAVLAISNAIYMTRISKLESAIEAGYSSAVEDLAQSAEQISAVLTKGRYASTPKMMTRLSNELTMRSGAAKSALESLPVREMELDNLEKFLAQVGNYAFALSEKAASGGSLSDEDLKNVAELESCAEKLSDKLWELRARALSSDSSISELFEDVDGEIGKFLADGFSEIENGLSEMPKLIYDGPFSDHILEKRPLMTEGKAEISEEEAAEKAAAALGVESYRVLKCEAAEEGNMPAYCFYCDGGRCAVSKAGGYIVYSMKYRNVRDEIISPEEAVASAENYLKNLGIESMTPTYHECYNGVCTINFAYDDGGKICYTDLIKVSAALDNGEILGFDARGFLVNHRERDFGEPKISEEEALEKISKSLSPESVRLAVIPTDSVEEKLCYEVKCKADGRNILVYVNAMTGDEEEILILLEVDGGTLTV